MKQETSQKLSIVALVFSLFPAISYVLPVFKISLADGAQAAMAAANILCSLVGFALSIICVKSKETRNAVNIISTIICVLWLLLIVGFGVLALFLTFVKTV